MIIPVLDLKDGIAVSGKAGKRDTYQPLQTVFNNNPHPHEIASSLKMAGASRIYIADLDAIENVGSNAEIIKEVNKVLPVMLDCGTSSIQEVQDALNIADKVIVATETLKKLDDLDHLLKGDIKDRIIISIDIKEDRLYSKYLEIDTETFIKKIDKLKPKEVILLDISRVGSESGFKKDYIKKFSTPGTSIILGGGIRPKDIDVLREEGAEMFLIGTALHKGEISLNILL
ncbi:MAG: HisA/HisF family protein [Methanomicrobiales archaeon]